MVGGSHIALDFSVVDSAEEKFRLAVESCPSGMVLTDGGGLIVLVNAEAERLFGYGRWELIGRKMEILVPERLRAAYIQRRAALSLHPSPLRLGESWNLFGKRRDGSEFPVEIGLNPIRTREGLFVLGVFVDISERRRMERLKDEFVSTVSHELRTPLTSIAGSLGLLAGGAAGALPETAARLIRIAQSNSQRLVRLVNDILDIEKIESGQVAFKFRRLGVRALIEQMIDANRSYADAFGIRIRLDSGAAHGDVYADPDRLAQVITNLLSNAIKFSPPQGEVTVNVIEGGPTVRVEIRDCGPGIPDDFKPRIFEKFAQADATDARRKGGTGLGLSIAKLIVTRLGGEIGFADADGGGTVFYFELPAWSEITTHDVDPEGGGDTVRILLCANDPEDALTLRDGLRQAGFSTDFARNQEDTVTRIAANTYAAIVLDVDGMDNNGGGFMRRLREQPKTYKTPMIVISSDHEWPKSLSPAVNLNVLERLQKPPDLVRLAEILSHAVMHNGNGRPKILHVDDDNDVRELVREMLESIASIVSAASADEARAAVPMHDFDLAIVDIDLGTVSGLDLLVDLRKRDGSPLPVIVFSAYAAELADNVQVEVNLSKSSSTSLSRLVDAVRDRLMLNAASVSMIPKFA
jgi:PAS domain S-box-containing protein